MRTIATLQEADSGTITFTGSQKSKGEINVLEQKDKVRSIVGYLPQEFGVYPKVSAEVLLDHLAVLKGITNRSERKEVVMALLNKTNLYDKRKKNLGGFSGGMKQRFGIAQALLANPELIIVDEPTAGLDPAERNRFHNLLSELGENTIVILSTHIVDDVKELCTDMAIINKGEVLLQVHPLRAIESLQNKVWRKRIERSEVESYQKRMSVISDRMSAGKPVIHVFSESQPEEGFEIVEADLEDVYFQTITNSQLPVTSK